MKIEGCGDIVEAVQKSILRSGTACGGEPFATLLVESMEKAKAGGSLQGNGHAHGTMQGSAIQGISLETGGASHGDLWEMGSQTLDAVERYQRGLADVSVPLDGLIPLIKDMRDQRASLCESLDKAAVNDRFKAVLAEVASLALSEIERFSTDLHAGT